jgi:hypothetical protein
MSRGAQLAEPPLTLTLSPEYRGEGTRGIDAKFVPTKWGQEFKDAI